MQKIGAVVLECITSGQKIPRSVDKPCGAVAQTGWPSWHPMGDNFSLKVVDILHLPESVGVFPGNPR